MKNKFKLQFVALAVALSAAACSGHKSSDNKDSVSSSSQDSMSTQDTIKHADTTVKVDTLKNATDTSDAKLDTVNKKTTSHTVIKKTAVEKGKYK